MIILAFPRININNDMTEIAQKQNQPFSATLAHSLLNCYGSPLYVYQSDLLRHSISHITTSIPYNNTLFQFATVTNGNIELLKLFNDQGWGIHANTPGDIYLGLKAGFSGEKIVYSGSNLNPEEMTQILKWGVRTLNLDSISQLELLYEIYKSFPGDLSSLKLGLRLNEPNLIKDSRIGVQPQEFPEAIKIAKRVGLNIQGLHFYRGTGTNATRAFTQVIDDIIQIGQLLPNWEYLDFGGGFGYPYHHDKIAFNWHKFGQELTDKLNQLSKPIQLIIEPGRAVIANCATLLAKVVSVKWQGDKQIIGVDTTVGNLSVPSVHGGYRKIISWPEKPQTLWLTDVCGNTTYSRDYLGKNCQLPALEIGDIIGILEVGAYGYAMSSHFLHRPRPAEVLLEKESHRLIRQREDYQVLIDNQILN
ncbi:decarboxylase [Crocosphaera watsonii]|uniref:diaminopimelate decarboxylase family protein n=1 Tax=Crocosphaera watsonii TaxID=263511 RepID=UPI0030DAF369